jgi:transcriptional regulator with XRE-family HTH domain
MINPFEDQEWAYVGERIRAARGAAGLSVRELARRISVSPSHVSQVERGLASFSVKALYSVASNLGISMDSLFEKAPAQELLDEVLATAEDGPLDESGMVLRRASRPTMKLQSGPRWESLTVKPEDGADFIEVTYPPALGAKPPDDFIRHVGREYGVIIKGSLSAQVGFARAEMAAGDSIAFDSSVPHRFWNQTAGEVVSVWFVWAPVSELDNDFRGAGFASHHHSDS